MLLLVHVCSILFVPAFGANWNILLDITHAYAHAAAGLNTTAESSGAGSVAYLNSQPLLSYDRHRANSSSPPLISLYPWTKLH